MKPLHILLFPTALMSLAAGGFAEDRAAADDALTDAVRNAVNVVASSVVRIETFGGLEKVGDLLIGSGPSTGLALSEDGFILCSAYSFAQQPTSVLVTLPSGKRAAAKVIARDHSRMLVLLKVNSDETLTPPAFVSRSEMKVGQTTIGLGRTYDPKAPNVTVGILSAVNRIWSKAIQTDAKISPANYGGPLIDLRGRVLGLLVPMSPDGEGALAGAQWYDSGIGFAVPLAEVMPQLDRLKQGEDLHPGKLGISLSGKDSFSQPVEIAAVLPGSPAAKAGLAKGDEVVEVDGKKVRWLAHLKHALGPRYAGESLEVVVRRDGKRVEATVDLVADIGAYDVPFLGLLPLRDDQGDGVKVRYVYDDSPADNAEIRAGDVVQTCDGVKVKSADQLRDIVGTHGRKDGALQMEIERDGNVKKHEIILASLPTDIPDKFPASRDDAQRAKPPADDAPVTGLVEMKVPEIANNCFAFVPESYDPKASYGLVVWLHAPGEFDKDAIEATWRALGEQNDLIVMVPQAEKPDAWQPTEAEFIRKAVDQVRDAYHISEHRIAIGGDQAGGTFAAMVAFSNLEVIRALAMVDAALPGRVAAPASDPVQRLAVFVAAAQESKLAKRIDADVKRLQDAKLPVTRLELGESSQSLDEQQRAKLARWVESLDRI